MEKARKCRYPCLPPLGSYSLLPPLKRKVGTTTLPETHQILKMSGHQAAYGMEWQANTPPPPPKKERSNPISAGHSALWGSSSLRRDGSDGRTRGDRQTTFLPIHLQLKKQNKDSHPPPLVATTLAREAFLFPGAVWPPAPAPMTKKRHSVSKAFLPPRVGEGGCRGEEAPPLTRAHTLGPENSRARRGAKASARGA